VESKVAISRIESFLCAPEIESTAIVGSADDSPFAIEIEGGQFIWESAPDKAPEATPQKGASKELGGKTAHKGDDKKDKKPVADAETAVKNVEAGKSDPDHVGMLLDINLKISRGSLVAIVGAVGSGKSSLVK
jgi:ABC-type glutathione transport system ATPase component